MNPMRDNHTTAARGFDPLSYTGSRPQPVIRIRLLLDPDHGDVFQRVTVVHLKKRKPRA
jgi:hypothetical protein